MRDSIALTLVYTIAFAVFINLMIFAKMGFVSIKSCILRKLKARKEALEKEMLEKELDEGNGQKLPS